MNVINVAISDVISNNDEQLLVEFQKKNKVQSSLNNTVVLFLEDSAFN